MLRKVLLAVGVTLLIAALAFAWAGWRMIPAAVFGAILVLSLLIERYIYKPVRTEAPGPGWDKTGERFGDPKSGKHVAVYFNPRTGERRYVAEPAPHGDAPAA